MPKTRTVRIGLAAALAFMARGGAARAAIKAQAVDYRIEGKPFGGPRLRRREKGKMPGVRLFPANSGIRDNEHLHAEALAKMGCVAFVADTHRKDGPHPTTQQEASARDDALCPGSRALSRARDGRSRRSDEGANG